MFKLYIYDHCPYCTRARMIFGYKNINYDLRYLLNDDEDNPIRMVGKKMVPILQKKDGSYMAESLDIVRYIDQSDHNEQFADQPNDQMTKWLEQANKLSYYLAMPRWVVSDLPEFSTPAAKLYFLKKKEAYLGNFYQYLENTDQLISEAQSLFEALGKLIKSKEGIRGRPSIDDILLFPILRSFTMVKDMDIPLDIRAYLAYQAEHSGVWLFDAFAV